MTLMKPTVVVIAAITLLATIFIISSNDCDERVAKPEAAADQFWAAALLSSLSFNDGEDVRVQRNFAEALRRTHRMAPILVTVGDTRTSLTAVRSLATRAFGQSSRPVFVPKGDPGDMAETILQGVSDLQDASMAAYQAAVREDSNCLVGWMRLTCAESEAIASNAAIELVRRNPDNAICHYIRAAFEPDIEMMVCRIAAGNRAQQFRTLAPEIPEHFHLYIPDTENFRSLKISGKRLGPTALRNMMTMNIQLGRPFRNSVDQTLRNACRKAFAHAEILKNCGDFKQARECLTELRHCGFRLIGDESTDIFLILLGINLINQSCDELRSLYHLTGDQENSELMTENLRQLETYRETLKPRHPSAEETRALLVGDLDYGVFSTAPYRVALRISGLKR